jgi:hypothetical protein
MIGQYDPGINGKWMFCLNPLDCLPQQFDFTNKQIILLPLRQVYRKKPCATGHKGTLVIGHKTLIWRKKVFLYMTRPCSQLSATFGRIGTLQITVIPAGIAGIHDCMDAGGRATQEQLPRTQGCGLWLVD